MDDPLIGQTLEKHFRIDALLAEGGMGKLYKAFDTMLAVERVLKVMHPQFARQPDFRQRFLKEAQTAARLKHPGIIKVHHFGEVGDLLYIVMDFITGDNLRQLLEELSKAKQWILLPEAIQVVRQVSLALDYAHRQGVLHRDIVEFAR